VTYRKRGTKPVKPMRVAEVLKSYLRSAGLAERVGQAGVVEEWPALVGPKIAKAASAESVTQDGTLFVRVPSSAWRQELSLMAPDILELVNRGRASGRIARIRWMVGDETTGARGHGGAGARVPHDQPHDQPPRGGRRGLPAPDAVASTSGAQPGVRGRDPSARPPRGQEMGRQGAPPPSTAYGRGTRAPRGETER